MGDNENKPNNTLNGAHCTSLFSPVSVETSRGFKFDNTCGGLCPAATNAPEASQIPGERLYSRVLRFPPLYFGSSSTLTRSNCLQIYSFSPNFVFILKYVIHSDIR